LPAYLNLGLLYWNKSDLEKATYYFQKRVELGRASDPWTKKAKAALVSIKLKESSLANQVVPNLEVPIKMEHEKDLTGIVSDKKTDHKDQERLKIVNQSLDGINLQQSPQEVTQEVVSKPAIDEALNLEIQKAQVLFTQGQKLASAQKYQEAIEHYDQALKISPGNPQIIKARVDAFLQWKQQATAE
jgi:tetratricopeptide (TPR) repeat protein